jgi:sialidase-1
MINARYKGKHLLLFSNAASQLKREKMTIRVSTDDGRSWPVSFLVDDGVVAYSDLVSTKKNHVGLLYEKENKGDIVYTAIALKKIMKNK